MLCKYNSVNKKHAGDLHLPSSRRTEVDPGSILPGVLHGLQGVLHGLRGLVRGAAATKTTSGSATVFSTVQLLSVHLYIYLLKISDICSYRLQKLFRIIHTLPNLAGKWGNIL